MTYDGYSILVVVLKCQKQTLSIRGQHNLPLRSAALYPPGLAQ